MTCCGQARLRQREGEGVKGRASVACGIHTGHTEVAQLIRRARKAASGEAKQSARAWEPNLEACERCCACVWSLRWASTVATNAPPNSARVRFTGTPAVSTCGEREKLLPVPGVWLGKPAPDARLRGKVTVLALLRALSVSPQRRAAVHGYNVVEAPHLRDESQKKSDGCSATRHRPTSYRHFSSLPHLRTIKCRAPGRRVALQAREKLCHLTQRDRRRNWGDRRL